MCFFAIFPLSNRLHWNSTSYFESNIARFFVSFNPNYNFSKNFLKRIHLSCKKSGNKNKKDFFFFFLIKIHPLFIFRLLSFSLKRSIIFTLVFVFYTQCKKVVIIKKWDWIIFLITQISNIVNWFDLYLCYLFPLNIQLNLATLIRKHLQIRNDDFLWI